MRYQEELYLGLVKEEQGGRLYLRSGTPRSICHGSPEKSHFHDFMAGTAFPESGSRFDMHRAFDRNDSIQQINRSSRSKCVKASMKVLLLSWLAWVSHTRKRKNYPDNRNMRMGAGADAMEVEGVSDTGSDAAWPPKGAIFAILPSGRKNTTFPPMEMSCGSLLGEELFVRGVCKFREL